MTNKTNMNRVGQIEAGMAQGQPKALGALQQFVFLKQENAVAAAELVGMTGAFSYTNDDDEEVWFPGKSMEDLQKHCKVSPQPKADAGVFKYKDPITQEFFYFERQGVHKKNGRPLVYIEKAESNLAKTIQKLEFPS